MANGDVDVDVDENEVVVCPLCTKNAYLYPLDCEHNLCLDCIKGRVMGETATECPYCDYAFTENYIQNIMYSPDKIRARDINGQIKAYFERYPGGLYVYEGQSGGCWLFAAHIQTEIITARANNITVFETVICGKKVTLDLLWGTQTGETRTRRIRKLTPLETFETFESINTINIKG